MIRFAENLNKMIAAGLGGAMEAPSTEVAVGHCVRHLEASGAVASFETNIAAPIRSLRVDMQPIQEGSGDPSPDNVRPITGRDSVTVTRTGVNVWDEEWEVGVIKADGTPASHAVNCIRSKNFCSIVGGETYYATCGKTDGGSQNMYYIAVFFYDADKTFIVRLWVNNQTFTAPDNARYFKLCTNSSTVVYGNTYNHDITVNYPLTDHDYHPGNVQSATIQLGQTIYGGTVDVTGGNAESEAIKITANDLPTPSVDSGNTGDGYYSFNFVLSAGKYAISGKQSLSKCNILPYIDSGKTARYAFFYMLEGHFRQLRIVVYSETELTKDTVKQWLSDHGFELVYYTDPTPLTLTPASLSTLRGDNNVWSDAGNVSLEYPYYEETEGY